MAAVMYSFAERRELEVIEGKAKLTKDGRAKRPANNRVEGRSTKVDPIMEKEYVAAILKYITGKINEATRPDYEWQWERNRMYFVLAINLRLRVSDMIGARKDKLVPVKKDGEIIDYVYPSWTGLKWGDLYDKKGNIKNMVTVRELKTGHVVEIPLDMMSQTAIENYVRKYLHTKWLKTMDLDDYVFVNRKLERLSHQTIYDFIKEVTRECGLEGNYGTHSFRKTGIYHLFMDTVDEEGTQWALVDTMALTGHRTETALLHYLGLDRRQKQDKTARMENYWAGVM